MRNRRAPLVSPVPPPGEAGEAPHSSTAVSAARLAAAMAACTMAIPPGSPRACCVFASTAPLRLARDRCAASRLRAFRCLVTKSGVSVAGAHSGSAAGEGGGGQRAPPWLPWPGEQPASAAEDPAPPADERPPPSDQARSGSAGPPATGHRPPVTEGDSPGGGPPAITHRGMGAPSVAFGSRNEGVVAASARENAQHLGHMRRRRCQRGGH